MSKYKHPEKRNDNRTKDFTKYLASNLDHWPDGVKAIAVSFNQKFSRYSEVESYKSLSQYVWTVVTRKMYMNAIAQVRDL